MGRKGGGLQETEGALRQAQELSPQIRKKKGKKRRARDATRKIKLKTKVRFEENKKADGERAKRKLRVKQRAGGVLTQAPLIPDLPLSMAIKPRRARVAIFMELF